LYAPVTTKVRPPVVSLRPPHLCAADLSDSSVHS
jgi:hypothetical protein